jgi:hypothetical protein
MCDSIHITLNYTPVDVLFFAALLTSPIFPPLDFLFRSARHRVFETCRKTPAYRLSDVLMCQRSCYTGTAMRSSFSKLWRDGRFTFDWSFGLICTGTMGIFFGNSLTGQNILLLLWRQEVYYCVQKNSPLDSMLRSVILPLTADTTVKAWAVLLPQLVSLCVRHRVTV